MASLSDSADTALKSYGLFSRSLWQMRFNSIIKKGITYGKILPDNATVFDSKLRN